MMNARVLHEKLMLAVDDFEHSVIAESNEKAKFMLDCYKQSVETVQKLTKKRVEDEYQKYMNHKECESRISTLRRENIIMKDEIARLMKLHGDLDSEVSALRTFKSTADAETVLLVNDVAKKKLQCAALQSKLKAAEEKIRALERKSAELEAEKVVSGVKAAAGLDVAPAAPRTIAPLTITRGEGYRDKENNTSGADEDDSRDSEMNDEEWKLWCKETEFSRPGWNKSTATKLLSQEAPPSVIHIGENPLVGVGEAIVEAAAIAGTGQSKFRVPGVVQVAVASCAAEAMALEIEEEPAAKKARKGSFASAFFGSSLNIASYQMNFSRGFMQSAGKNQKNLGSFLSWSA
ncbi:hypothetical protein DFJ73DRAFT_319701 [Zopfochytrium polystomum]|nr:hypothetical protein DFJ73DRAFT_319701 [Zopfochytrium polystomum]